MVVSRRNPTGKKLPQDMVCFLERKPDGLPYIRPAAAAKSMEKLRVPAFFPLPALLQADVIVSAKNCRKMMCRDWHRSV
jgi:hypothetical protein